MSQMKKSPWLPAILLGLALAAVALTGCDEEECLGLVCDGECVNTEDDPDHCGRCDNACDADEVCRGGACQAACPDGETLCDGACVDLQTSADHCGDCDTVCGSGNVCSAGECVVACPEGQTACDGGCFDLQSAEPHCGDCETSCGAGEACVDGECAASCGPGLTDCDGVCADLDRDRDHCGDCGIACAASQACVDGGCSGICSGDDAECGGTCHDLDSDRDHCGDCETSCEDGEICEDGECLRTCGGATPTLCGDACVDLEVDPFHCGDCDTACDPGFVCSEGDCASACAPGLTECGAACVDTSTNPGYCGACDVVCPTAPNADAACVGGECRVACDLEHGDCNHDLPLPGTDGCEVDLMRTVEHCGACGAGCTIAHGAAACIRGRCGVGYCDTGFDDCNGDPADGCESDLESDPLHCGGCGSPCAVDEICESGLCLPLAGEDCSSALPLAPGSNSLSWTAISNDYLTTAPSCHSTTYDIEGPDVVLSYTATVSTAVGITVAKPASARMIMVISDATCGTLTELACVEEYTAPALAATFTAAAGTTYYVYLIDTDSGTATLPNPLDVTVAEAGCAPGAGGVVGTSYSPVPSGPAISSEYYVAADQSPTGWVYVGGTSDLYRQPKAGGAVEDVEATAALGTSRLGYAMVIDGDDIYTVESSTTLSSGIVWRITTDGGSTWTPEDYVSFPSTPGDDIRGAAVYEGRLYLVTDESSSSTATEIWSVPTGATTLPVTATLELSFTGEAYCDAIAVDDDFYYLACGTSDRVVRVDRATAAVELIGSMADLSTTVNSIYVRDLDADGVADVAYVQGWYELVYYICDPATAAPFMGLLVDFGGTSSNYGMGFDPVGNELWVYDDDDDTFASIE